MVDIETLVSSPYCDMDSTNTYLRSDTNRVHKHTIGFHPSSLIFPARYPRASASSSRTAFTTAYQDIYLATADVQL